MRTATRATLRYEVRDNETGPGDTTLRPFMASRVERGFARTGAAILSMILCGGRLLAQPAEPTITAHPTNRTVNFGESASFTVTASGNPLPEYQWRFEENDLLDETNATLWILSAHTTNAGNYSVVVSNVAGVISSAVATLTVITQAPIITAQPTNRNVTAGEATFISLGAEGIPAPRYQWFFNDSPLEGQTFPILHLRNILPAQAGGYRASLSNVAGVVTSETMVLTVNPAPTGPGKPDLDFYAGSGPNNPVTALAIQPDGKVIIAGQFTSINDTNTRSRLARLNADGGLDLTFSSQPGLDTTVNAAALQPDGKILVAGAFSQAGGLPRPRVARFQSDGRVDTNFSAGFNHPAATALAVQPDGKVVVGWRVEGFGGGYLVNRLQTNGTIDLNFKGVTAPPAEGGTASLPSAAWAVALQPDTKVVAAGDFGVLRFLPNGHTDLTFARPRGPAGVTFTVRALAVQNDGKILIGGPFSTVNGMARNALARLNGDGSVDASFVPDISSGTVLAIAVQSDGRVLIGGSFTSVGGVPRNGIARLNSDGSLDTTFDPGRGLEGFGNSAFTIAVTPDGQPMIAGSFGTVNGAYRRMIARLHNDSAAAPTIVDQPVSASVGAGQQVSFFVNVTCCPAPGFQWRFNDRRISGATGAVLRLSNVELTNSGNYTVVVSNALGSVTSLVATLTVTNPPVHPGSLDVSLAGSFGANDSVYAVLPEPDGKIVIGGAFSSVRGVARRCVARFNANGTLDGSFDPGTNLNTTIVVYALARQSTGKILVGGAFTTGGFYTYGFLKRFHTNGAPDTTWAYIDFVTGTTVYSIATRADDWVYYAGNVYNGVRRVNANGFYDGSFQSVPGIGYLNSPVYALALQGDGKLIIGGQFTTENSPRRNLLRLLTNGVLDTTFTNHGTAGPVYAIDVHSDGIIYVGGSFTNIALFNGGVRRGRIAKLTRDGGVDATFPVTEGANSTVRAVHVQHDGKVIIGGAFTAVNGIGRNAFARLNADGTLDLGYYPGTGFDGTVHSLTEQPDGHILVGGDFSQVDGRLRNGLARIRGGLSLFNPMRIGNTFRVSFGASQGHTYYLEYKNALDDSPWMEAGSVTGNGLVNTLTDADVTATARFYRVRVE